MTGLDCLKEEMLRRGLTKAQCESKTVAVVLDILANSGTSYTEQYDIENHLEKLKQECADTERYLHNLRGQYQKEREEIVKWKDEIQQYVDGLLEQLKTCETKEGQDRLKLAQMFVDSVNVQTKYDNTAFIIGLSAILSSGEVAPVEELRKINNKIPSGRKVL
ncbi:MAG: hypothetical protein IJI57_04445 [Flexilinea sp.]|nr:hypothetical protein [Flexilinea sp.]